MTLPAPIVTQPLIFLGATVLSFNSTLGFGQQESTLSVDLIEDCQTDPPQAFGPRIGTYSIGQPVYFTTQGVSPSNYFDFGGIITNWTINQSSSGKVYNVKISDPRAVLENCAVIVDSYLGPPLQTKNYFNVYASYEGGVLNQDCRGFGTSWSSERGMPYQKIINGLKSMNPTIYSPTNYPFTIDFSSFPTGLPEYYRVPGPSIGLLQLVSDVCDVLGLDFFITMNEQYVIKINTISLNQQPQTFDWIINSFNGTATDLSYGQELRNDKTRSLIFGEQQHYLTYVNNFDFFFGTDELTGDPIIPYARDACVGFWIAKRINTLNASLNMPFPTNGPYTISELDIRAAMSSYELWKTRVFNTSTPGTLNAAIRQLHPEGVADLDNAINTLANGATALDRSLSISDSVNNPRQRDIYVNKYNVTDDLKKIHAFVQNLGDTYYGRQYIASLNQLICYNRSTDGQNYSQLIFSEIPTNAGGWVDAGTQVLGLSEPELSFFRQDDNRIGSFAQFSIDGASPPPENPNIGMQSPNINDLVE